MIENIDYHLIDRCNLNCMSCGHFSPLVPRSNNPISFEQAKEELNELARITENGKHINWVTLTGGEIALNPNLKSIAEYAFELFGTKLRLWTNGLLAPKLDCIKEVLLKGATLHLTYYAQNFTERAIQYFNDNGIPFKYIPHQNGTDIDFNTQFFSRNRVTNNDQALNCEARYFCTQYKDFKLYPCQYLAYSSYFNEYFREDGFNLDDQCYLDVRMYDEWNHLEYFLKNRISWSCYHCREAAGLTNTKPWKLSEHDIKEWVAD